jgi:hypothetical protein
MKSKLAVTTCCASGENIALTNLAGIAFQLGNYLTVAKFYTRAVLSSLAVTTRLHAECGRSERRCMLGSAHESIHRLGRSPKHTFSA